MNALVDYGTSSSSSSSDSEDETAKEVKQEERTKLPGPSKLPKPTLGAAGVLQTSVFSNPFVEAELAKSAILEKHVKMVAGKEDTQMINGKKICWNYRKGRCRFGHNCKYAHDTDIQKTNDELEAEKQKLKSVVCESIGTMASGPPPSAPLDEVSPTDDVLWEGGGDRKKRKRPGLSQTLVPGKRVLDMYNKQKNKNSKK